MNDFPRMLFRQPGLEPMHGGQFSTLIVADEDELDAALAEGWHETTTAAKEAHEAKQAAAKLAEPAGDKLPADDSSKPPTRAELEQKATELGIEFSPKIGDAKLAERIAAKLAE